MCKICRPILGAAVKPHAESICPLLQGSYCGVCASNGHSPRNCPDGAVRKLREPQYLEQLIPPSILESMNITSQTPLPASANRAASEPEKPVLQVPDTERDIRACLMSYGIQYSGKAKENKRLLQTLADTLGRRLIYTMVPAEKMGKE